MSQAVASDASFVEAVSHLVGLLRDFDTATLVTRTRMGSLHGRPMAVAQVDDNATIWFVTSRRSSKVQELVDDSRAMVTLQGSSRFACLNGNAELVEDPRQIAELWRDEYRVWYENQADPDVVLVRFCAFDAEYWDHSGLEGLKYAFQAARAYVTGRKLQQAPELVTEASSHAKLKLWQSPAPSTHSDR